MRRAFALLTVTVLMAGMAVPRAFARDHADAPVSLTMPEVDGGVRALRPPPVASGANKPAGVSQAARPDASSPRVPAPVVLKPVTLVAIQHATWGRLSVVLRGNPAPEMRQVKDDVELRFAPGTLLKVSPPPRLRETGPIEILEADGASVIRVHLLCRCVSEARNEDGLVRVDVRPAAGPANVTAAKAAEAEEMGQLRATLTDKLAKLNGTPPPKPPTLVADAAIALPPAPKLAIGGTAAVQQEPLLSPAQVCAAPVDASRWRGAGGFTERLVALRAQVASSRAAAADVAALAEFYLANGLGHEAMAVAVEALQADATAEERTRLGRDADIARLLKGEPVAADSALLATPDGCTRADAPLWRALAAAAARDADGAARDPEAAATALRTMPGPLLRGLAFRIAVGVGENLNALHAVANILRNSTDENPEDASRHFLLRARIASLVGDRSEYAAFLAQAARSGMTVPGVVAKARLAGIRSAEGGPEAAHYEEVLADMSRTYRHEVLGQQAAEQYAELNLRRHNYAAALAIADECAGPRGPQISESRGAGIAVRILRMLFVEPATAALPDPAERIALFLRYGGYTTPGEKGDDIRLAVARLMLTQRFPDAALETIRQMSAANLALPDAARMLAEAEAYAGDPAKALELIKALPDDAGSRRLAAEATKRMNQPLQAAHLLDSATGIQDREYRAGLLFAGWAWKESASAYSDLLRDPMLPAAMRDDLAKRYALAVAMTGEAPAGEAPAGEASAVTLAKLPEGPARLLSVSPVPSGASPGLASLRGALDRARRIETLLGPAPAHQGS